MTRDGTMTAMPADIVVRNPTEAEFRRFIAPLSIAFNRRMSDAEIDAERRTIELDRFIGALDGDAVVGCGGAYSFRMTVPGGQVAAAGIMGVGVLPTHRRRGILRQMMGWWFDQARQRQEPIAILWASEAAIYQRFGYGPATQQTFLEAPTAKIRFLRPVEPPGPIRIVEPDEALALFPPIYEALRPTVPGAVARPVARWREDLLADTEWSRRDSGDKVLAVLERDGSPTGYAIYRQRSDWDYSGPRSVLTVMDVAALDPVTEQAIWEWLFSIDLIATVRVWRGPAPHPLQLMVTEPRRLSVTLNDGLWLRIIDLPAALEARAYGRGGTLVLEVTDAFCPSNAGRWELSVAEGDGERVGAARVRAAPPTSEVDIALDIADIAAVYLGAFRFADLARVGRGVACRPGGIESADALFSHAARPNASTMF
jgi:predicted acetyltransferase